MPSQDLSQACSGAGYMVASDGAQRPHPRAALQARAGANLLPGARRKLPDPSPRSEPLLQHRCQL